MLGADLGLDKGVVSNSVVVTNTSWEESLD
jgi:hypothetical protein